MGRLSISTPAAALGAGLSVGRRLARTGQNALGALQQVPAMLSRIEELLTAAELVVVRIDTVTGKAQHVVARVQRTRVEAALVVQAAADLEKLSGSLLTDLQPLLAAAADIDPALVQAVTRLVDQLQPLMSVAGGLDPNIPAEASDLLMRSRPLVEQFSTLILPLLSEMRAAVPDVREILPVVQRLEPVLVDVETRIAGLPGAGRLRRRGEREIEEAPQLKTHPRTFMTNPSQTRRPVISGRRDRTVQWPAANLIPDPSSGRAASGGCRGRASWTPR
jgi:hypothetical protein